MSSRIVIIRNAKATDFGGGERVPVYVAREVATYGIEAIVLSGSDKLLNFAQQENVPHLKTWWWSRQNWSGSRVIIFPIYFIWQIILYFYYLILFIRLNPSVVHLQSKDDFIAGTFAARTIRKRVLWSDYADLKHIWLNLGVWYKNPVGKLVYIASHLVQKIIVVSLEDKKLVSKHLPTGSIKNKLTVIYNGAFDEYRSIERKSGSVIFISTARLVGDKGIKELILAFKKLRQKHDNVELNLIGDGPERSRFESIANNLKGISFYGHRANPIEFLVRSDVFVLPTYHEGFSVALVEACMAGCAIITTNVGGNPEIIDHDKNGLLVPIKDTDSLFMAMDKLYNNRDLRKRLASNARRKYLKSFNFAAIIKKEFVPLYSHVDKD